MSSTPTAGTPAASSIAAIFAGARCERGCVLALQRRRRSDCDRLREHRHVSVARRGYFRAEDHARAQYPPRAERFDQRLDIAKPILHRDEYTVVRQPLGQRRRDRLGVVTLYRAQDQAERTPKLRGIVGQLQAGDSSIAEQSRNSQAVARDRLEMRSAAEQGDVVAGVMQHPADNRADRAGARDQD